MGKTIFALTAAALAIGLFFFYTKPVYDSTGAVQADIEQYNQALDKAQQLLQKKQQLMTRFNQFSPSDLDRLQKMLPDHVDNVALILDFDSLASRFGMGLENVDVSMPSEGSGGSSAPGTISAPSSSSKYESITMKFSTVGTYTNFRSFLNSLEQSLRVVDITSLSLTPQSGASAANGDPLYKFDIAMKTYWLK